MVRRAYAPPPIHIPNMPTKYLDATDESFNADIYSNDLYSYSSMLIKL